MIISYFVFMFFKINFSREVEPFQQDRFLFEQNFAKQKAKKTPSKQQPQNMKKKKKEKR